MKKNYQNNMNFGTLQDQRKCKIVKYSAFAVLACSMVLYSGISIQDKNIEHKNDIKPTYEYTSHDNQAEIIHAVPFGYVLAHDEKGTERVVKVIGELADPDYQDQKEYIVVKRENGEYECFENKQCDFYADGYTIVRTKEKFHTTYYAIA